MKGIILAGGSGTRLYPLTLAVSKQLMPVYDKPMIYYPLATLMGAGIREILIITTPTDSRLFQALLGDGSQLGCSFTYAQQEAPRGIAEAFLIGKEFIGAEKVALVLGDNIFYGTGLAAQLRANSDPNGAVIFGYHVQNPSRYGVVNLDAEGNVTFLEEKPEYPKSKYAIPGIYFYDNRVIGFAENLKPSARGELEITDINNAYLKQGALQVQILDRGTAWLDTGTFESLMQASQFVEVIESRQGLKIGAIEEVAFQMGYIGPGQLQKLAEPLQKSGYGLYLLGLIDSTKQE